MNVQVLVDRTELAAADLDVTAGAYDIEGETGIDFGGRTWRRNMVDSPFVHGSFPVTQALENSTLGLAIQVRAASQDALATAIAVLVSAFSQFEYSVTIKFDDADRQWTCWAADMTVGTHDERFGQWNVVVQVQIPRSPIQIDDGGV